MNRGGERETEERERGIDTLIRSRRGEGWDGDLFARDLDPTAGIGRSLFSRY